MTNTGGIAALIELICTTRTTTKPPAIMALGYIAGHSAQMAMIAIESKGASQLASVLEQETDDDILAITAWALGQMGKHSPDHAKAIATTNIFPRILQVKLSINNFERRNKSIKFNNGSFYFFNFIFTALLIVKQFREFEGQN